MILLNKIKIPQTYKTFFIILSIVAIIAGSLFYFKLDLNNQNLIETYMDAYFFNNESSSILNILSFNLILFVLIWIFGLSMFGSAFIAFIYFVKVFLLSISVSSIFSLENSSGALKAFFYVFPNQILSIFIYALLAIYAINFSFLFFKILFQKKDVAFKNIFKSYNKIFIVLYIFNILVIIYQVYLNPLIFKLVFK